MSKWETIKLGDIAEIVMGQSPTGDTCNDNGIGLPLLNGPTEFGPKHPHPIQFTTNPKKSAKAGDLLFCVRGSTTGKMNWADQVYAIGRGIAAIRGVNNYPNSFVRAVIEFKLDHLLVQATGSTFPNVSRDMIHGMEVPYISVEKAKTIASILEPIDDKIAINREMNKTLEVMAQAIFKSWFVDFEPFKEGEFVESELGMIPKGWEVREAQEIADIGIGKTPPRKEPQWFSEDSNDIRWVSIRDLGESGSFVLSTNEYLTEEAVRKFNVRIVPDNTVLLSFKLTVGRVALSDGEMTTNEAIAHFKIGKGYLISEYIYSYLKDFDYEKLGSTSSIATAVNSQSIKSMKILVPTKKVIDDYKLVIKDHFMMIKNNLRQVNQLSTIRDTLLPKLLSGEIEV